MPTINLFGRECELSGMSIVAGATCRSGGFLARVTGTYGCIEEDFGNGGQMVLRVEIYRNNPTEVAEALAVAWGKYILERRRAFDWGLTAAREASKP